jgi:hypothetical protein
MPDLIINWWQPREPSQVHLDLIREGLRRHRKYFRGAKLKIRTDSEQLPGTVVIEGDDAMEIEVGQFLHLVEDVTG